MLLKQSPESIVSLAVQGQNNPRKKKLVSRAQALGVRLQPDQFASYLKALPSQTVHQGVIAQVVPKMAISEKQWLAQLEQAMAAPLPPMVLFLDEVQDPHNLGAILRTADAVGVQAVVIPKHQSVGLNATVRKVASGAAESVTLVVVANLARAMAKAQKVGLWLTGMAGETSSTLYQADLTGPVGLVLGAEGRGLRPLVRQQCDFVAALPMQGRVDSLNVSVAAGVALYEAFRQRSKSTQ